MGTWADLPPLCGAVGRPPPWFVQSPKHCESLEYLGGLTDDRAGGGMAGSSAVCSGFERAPWAEPSSSTPLPAEDGPLRCKQLTLLLGWAEQFEAESRHNDEAVAFSVLLGDLNFDNCSLGEGRLRPGGAGRVAWPRPPSAGLSSQTTHRSRSTSSSAASRTPAGWARAGSSPGPWVWRPGGRRT